MRKTLWVISLICSALSVLILVFVFPQATGAPQEASISALALAISIIPYLIARAYSELRAPLPGKDGIESKT